MIYLITTENDLPSVFVQEINLASIGNRFVEFLQLGDLDVLQENCQQALGSVHTKEWVVQNLGVDIVQLVVVFAGFALQNPKAPRRATV